MKERPSHLIPLLGGCLLAVLLLVWLAQSSSLLWNFQPFAPGRPPALPAPATRPAQTERKPGPRPIAAAARTLPANLLANELLAYLRRCRPKCIGVVIGVMNLMELLNENNYADPLGEILHYFGEVFQRNTKMLVYPYQPTSDAELITLQNYPISDNLKHLFEFLKSSGFLIDINGYNPELLQIFSNNVIQMIKTGEEGWEQYVPEFVSEYIKARCLFDYPCEVKH